MTMPLEFESPYLTENHVGQWASRLASDICVHSLKPFNLHNSVPATTFRLAQGCLQTLHDHPSLCCSIHNADASDIIISRTNSHLLPDPISFWVMQGSLISSKPWFDLKGQEIQPLFQEFLHLKIYFDFADPDTVCLTLQWLEARVCDAAAYNGGQALCITGMTCAWICRQPFPDVGLKGFLSGCSHILHAQ